MLFAARHLRAVLFSLILVLPGCYLPNHTSEGAAVGAGLGGLAGGIIGHQNDETPEGAIIGGVVGAVAGGLAGRARDQCRCAAALCQ